jgi:SAM-dependent methyltransferase
MAPDVLRDWIGSCISSRWKFEWCYWRGNTPWGTNITPPEVMEFLAAATPGSALDLGRGTGTNAITLARRGWRAAGVDFSPKAIRAARRKARQAGLKVDFHRADVADLGVLSGAFDYVLDIGCLFTLKEDARIKYAAELARLLHPRGNYMLYAWLPGPWKGSTYEISAQAVQSLLVGAFVRSRLVVGREKNYPSAWYGYRRHNPRAEGPTKP